jgi:hypothetical protein
MSGDSKSTKNTSQSTSTSYDPSIINAGQGIFNNAATWFNNNPSYPMFQGDRVADFGPTFGAAEQAATAANGQVNPLTATGGDALKSLAGSIDPNASIQSLMDPYVGATLQPTLRNINESYDKSQAGIGADATGAGAFGDSGFGLASALNSRNRAQAIGDATSGAYDKAFNAATAEKNAQAGQLTSAASGLGSLGAQESTQQNAITQLLASLGATKQTAEQGGINSLISDTNTAANYPLKSSLALSSILGSIPKNTSGTSTGTETDSKPDNTLSSLGGSALSFLLFGK